MSAWWQFNALVRKNLLSMKRSVGMTCVEIFFPIVLMAIGYIIRTAFQIDTYKWKGEKGYINYFANRSVASVPSETLTNSITLGTYKDLLTADDSSLNSTELEIKNSLKSMIAKDPTLLKKLGSGSWIYEDPLENRYPAVQLPTFYGFQLKPMLQICYNRPAIAFIGNVPDEIINEFNKSTILDKLFFGSTENGFYNSLFSTRFKSIEELNKYIKSDDYGLGDKFKICFGLYFNYDEEKKTFDYSLHYFDNYITNGIRDVPNNNEEPNDELQIGPNMEEYMRYSNAGYMNMLGIVSNYILKNVTDNTNAKIEYGMMVDKYDKYQYDRFADFNGIYITFFIVLSYLCPMILYVLKMVEEKENRSKEAMKIMGMSELTYFLSYFVVYFCLNIIYAFGAGLFTYLIVDHIPYMYVVGYLWLFGLCIFAFAFFCQSFIDTTRLALIISCLIYCLMLFVAAAVWDETTKKSYKQLASVLFPVNLLLGTLVMGVFQAKFHDFHSSNFDCNYQNYSLATGYYMFAIDFFIFLILGWYLQNVVPHTFGIQRPWYFPFTKSYWCRKGSKKQIVEDKGKESEEEKLNPNEGNPNFQNEDLYKDKTGPNDLLKIRKLVKVFDDGKRAVDGVSFNLYKDEIFALLGHNGAGKTTIISMLTGMFEATEGLALYGGKNILDDINMDEFRNKLGICPQHDILFGVLTVREHLEMFCYFKGVPSEEIENEVNQTLKDFRIHDIADIVAKELSAGQQRKLSIAIAVIGGSEVIFLDEPSSGMDITSRRNLWEILKKITEKRIIILTTHYMEEAAVLGSRIGILADGQMQCIGTPLFLIERYGKFMSVNITKERGADDGKIIDFFKSKSPKVEYEKLSEEILFKIPRKCKGDSNDIEEIDLNGDKIDELNLKEFFTNLDENIENLQIKSYSAAMPTLEDVFLNVATIKKPEEMKNKDNDDNPRMLECDKIMFEQKYEGNFAKSQKFVSDLEILFKKRFKAVYRDKKTFFLEIICPILLVLVGCIVVQIDIFKETDPIYPNLAEFGDQVVYYGTDNSNINIDNSFLINGTNVTSIILKNDKSDTGDTFNNIQNYLDTIYNRQKLKKGKNNFGSMYMISQDDTNFQYSFGVLINAQARQGPFLYCQYFLNQVIERAAQLNNKDIKINYIHYPLPMTKDIKSIGKSLNKYCLVFFVNIAFGLIPANFITQIVKERINNTKHLMRISGVSLIAYWLVNYAFELSKYYFTGGICLLLLWAFDFFPRYFYIMYLLYGPAMVSSTYLMANFFSSESIAQNSSILINLVIGALGSTVCIMLRSLEDTIDTAKAISWVFRLLPSFCFGFGYNQLMNYVLILYLDYSVGYTSKPKSIRIKPKYSGGDAIYMGTEAVVYLLIMIIFESMAYYYPTVSDEKIENDVEDSMVIKEIDKANQADNIMILDTNRNQKNENIENHQDDYVTTTEKKINSEDNEKQSYSVRLKNIKKIFNKTGCCNGQVVAIKNLSFCVEYGECFGLMGLNGAGKTTTFKCITQEHAPTNGSIFINGLNISKRFDDVREMFGYCPQFDALFEYMTVYENLEFYSKIKGVDPSKIDNLVSAMIDSMTLSNYRNKLSGHLSGGNKRKLSVAISMICNPPIILLDEPSTGMDPEARRFMWAVIHKICTKRKKSSVIMTTHAMDEAETLCQRMGIMVNGEFVCLGSANHIKEKYGYGFEIDVRIKPYTKEMMEETFKKYNWDKNLKVTPENLDEILEVLGKKNFKKYIAKDSFGKKIQNEIFVSGYCRINSLVSWIHYSSNAMKMINEAAKEFEEIILTEFIENNFLFKIKKNEDGKTKSIGYLFSLLESTKDSCNITEYSIQQTSLEQIFNDFAKGQGLTKEELAKAEKKTEIKITSELLSDILS